MKERRESADWFPDVQTMPPIRPGYSGLKLKGGYPAAPGTGPTGETCGTCVHAVQVDGFYKCKLIESKWTHGYGTDIKLKSPACSKFESWPNSPEYMVLLSLIERAPRDKEPDNLQGIHFSNAQSRDNYLRTMLTVIPTAREKAMLKSGMTIRGKARIRVNQDGKFSVMLSKPHRKLVH